MTKYLIQKLTKKYVVRNAKPFLVTDAVDFIEKNIADGSRVLEVGAGNSTIWFLAHGCRVTSLNITKTGLKILKIVLNDFEIIFLACWK